MTPKHQSGRRKYGWSVFVWRSCLVYWVFLTACGPKTPGVNTYGACPRQEALRALSARCLSCPKLQAYLPLRVASKSKRRGPSGIERKLTQICQVAGPVRALAPSEPCREDWRQRTRPRPWGPGAGNHATPQAPRQTNSKAIVRGEKRRTTATRCRLDDGARPGPASRSV